MLDLEPVKENNKTLDLQPIENNNGGLDLEPIKDNTLQGGVEQTRFVNRDVNLQSIPVNAMKDLGDITTGIAGLIGGAVNAGVVTPAKRIMAGEPIMQKQDFTNAWEFAKQLPSALKTGLKEDYGQANIDMISPSGVKLDLTGLAQSFAAHPLNRALDVLSLGTIGAGKRIADTSRLTSKMIKPVGNIEKTLKYSPNLAIEGLQRLAETKPVQSLVNFADKSPALNQLQTGVADFLGAKPESRLLGTVGANKRAAKLLEQKNQIANINQRNAAINLNKQALGDITEEQGKQLVQAIERGEQVPENLKEARGILKEKVSANAEQYIASGNLDKQVAQDLPINQYASIKYNKPIQELTEVEKKSALKDISKLPDEQKPFYVPIMYDEKLKASDFFANTTKSYKAPELKQRKVGMDVAEGSKYGNRVYSPVELMNRLDAHRIKMVNTEKMINEIKDTFAKPYNSKTDTLLDGYVPFNPDAFLKFYRGSIDLNKLTMAKLQELDNVDNAFRSAIQESIRQLPEDIKNYMGVVKNNNIYQIPKEVLESLMSGKSSKGGLETLYDTMTGSFKRKVLGLSPKWFINNRIGNGIMASLKGVTPEYLVKAIKTSDNLLPEELKSKSLYEAEKTVIGRTGGGSTGALSSTLRLIGGEFIDTSTLKGLAKAQAMGANVLGVPGAVINKVTDAAFKFNQVFEDLERKAVYLKNVDKIGKQYIKNVGQKITTQDELLKYAIEEPQLQEQVMKAVDDTLGDYSNMTSAERRIVRKIVPFYSWTRTITRYAMSLPETNPLRADLTAKIMEAQALSMEDSETPEFQKGSVNTGMVNPITGKEYVLNYRRSVPFETFGSVGDNTLSLLNPIIQQMINSGAGSDVTFTGNAFSSPNYGTDYSGRYYNKETGEYTDLPASEKLLSFPLGVVRNTIPFAPETEKVLTSLFTGRLPDELYSTSLGGYNYDEVQKRPKGYTMQDQIIKNFLPLQQKAQKRYKK